MGKFWIGDDLDMLIAESRQDPEYVAAEKELKPLLDLADDILDLRLGKGWSQTRLAQEANIARQSIYGIERGLANPTVRTIQKLAKAFDAELVIHLQRKREKRS